MWSGLILISHFTLLQEAAKKAGTASSSSPGEIESAASKADVQKPVKPIAGYTTLQFDMTYCTHVTPYRQEEIKMRRVWRLFGGGRLWSLSLLCWQAKIRWTWQEEAMLCEEKVWVNNNFPFTEIVMLTLTTFMWLCVGSLLSTTKSGKTIQMNITKSLFANLHRFAINKLYSTLFGA